MTITLSILAEKLKNIYPCKQNKDTFIDRPLSSPLLYGGSRMIQGRVYVAAAEDLRPEMIYGMTVICAGEPSFDTTGLSCDLLMADALDVFSLFNQVQGAFFAMMDWDSRLNDAATDQMDIQELLDVARQELPLSFYFLNKNYTVLAASPGGGETDEEMLISHLLNDETAGSQAMTEIPRYFSNDELSMHGYSCNFYYADDYRGKLLAVCPLDTPLGKAHLSLLEIVYDYLERMYRLYSISSLSTPGYKLLRQSLRTILEPERLGSRILDREQIMTALSETGWKAGDVYELYYIPFGDNLSLSSRSEYLITLLENRWSMARTVSSRGLVLEGGIAWVVNTSLPAEITFQEFRPEFEEILGSFRTKAGASALCTDFFSLSFYLEQASAAIRLGSRIHPDKQLYMFSEYSLDYTISNATVNFKMEDVIHPCIPTLMAYDKENNTEFCKTLRMYIRCQYNVLKASSLLYVHRSTFSVRIKRIESLCGIDLEDERTRLHILISFYIMEAAGKQPY